MVATAGKYGIRLVLTLANYLPSYGGAPKDVQWLGGTSITDFWTRPDIRYRGKLLGVASSQSSSSVAQHSRI